MDSYVFLPSPNQTDRKESIMVKKKILVPNRIRRIEGGFSFIPHRFLTDGFLASLSQTEILIYLFLIIVSDRNGLSFYSYDAICTLLELSIDEYIEARNALIKKDLIAFDGTLFQVLDLPGKPAKKEVKPSSQSHRRSEMRDLIQQSIREI